MFWDTEAGDNGNVTLVVDSAITEMDDGTWKGALLTTPFNEVECTANNAMEARRALARYVLGRVNHDVLPVAAPSVAAVRLLTTTERRYLRGGEVTPVQIYVPALADKMSDGWHAQTTTGAGKLYPEVGEGADFAAACDALAAKLMVALEVGVEGVTQDWSALRLLVVTRKTFRTEQLQDI